MKKNFSGQIIIFLFFLLSACVSIIIAKNLFGASDALSLGIATAIAIAGALWLIISLSAKPAPTIAPAAGAPAGATPAPTRAAPQTAGTIAWGLVCLVILILIIAAILFGLYKGCTCLAEFGEKNLASLPETKVIQPLIIGHTYREQETARFAETLNTGTTYKAFYLNSGDSWEWTYFDEPFSYRVKTSDDAPFTSVPKLSMGMKRTAQNDGMLEIRTDYPDNKVVFKRISIKR